METIKSIKASENDHKYPQKTKGWLLLFSHHAAACCGHSIVDKILLHLILRSLLASYSQLGEGAQSDNRQGAVVKGDDIITRFLGHKPSEGRFLTIKQAFDGCKISHLHQGDTEHKI